MLSLVVAAGVGIWFFRSAHARQMTDWMWALIGAVSYAGVATLVGNVSFAIASPIRVQDLHQIALTITIGSLVIAFVVVFFIHATFLRKPAEESVAAESDDE